MPTDYNLDRTAEEYREAKSHPWRSRVEAYSFLKLIGDVGGKKVLDLACGEGHYTRMLRSAGASAVVGSDISARMIELALAQEAREPMGIEYLVEDASTVVPQQDFDLAVSAFLLANARDRAELAQMCKGVASRVRAGGRFVTIAINPGVYSFHPVPDYRKYGFEMKLADRPYEGAPIRFTLHLDRARTEIENYFLPLEAYESALLAADFANITIHTPELSPAPEAADEGDYWDDMLNHPFLVLLDCVKE